MTNFLCALVLTLSAVGALAQPQLSYIIPDIGTTRFGTYVEFIGPANRNGNFGTDGIYLNNPGDAVRIRCVNDGDTLKVKFGPAVVSWGGRMVSSHVYVLPMIVPNSSDWRQLDAAYRIPIVVEVNGQRSNPDTFYIVRPFSFGDKRASADRVIGEGALGQRSRRGAMLIDSALLASGAPYTISMLDPDAQAPGNQAFLPFVMIAVGNITGMSGTEIRADASGPNGGPGGGGGGGGYGNAPLFGPGQQGTAGGNGYTGGGPGGRNNSGVNGSNSKRKPGIGSGEDLPEAGPNTVGGKSLNGTSGGDSGPAYENAGGGTGHPFGQSGLACDARTSCDPAGQAGGGSGHRDGRRGGAGGFGTDGGSDNGANNGGKAHGNASLIPLAGGSGGASGNPATLGDVSSPGGGGGGGVSIHAQRLALFDVYSLGAATSRQDVLAGSGSGGGIILGMRLDNAGIGFTSGQAYAPDVTGFLTGGRGRTRYDARASVSNTYYVGPLTDTMMNSLRTIRLTGCGNGSDIQIYTKGEHGPWIAGPRVSGYSGTWNVSFTLPGTDTLYFISVAQNIPLPKHSTYENDPDWVLSQSSWNIVRIYGPPVIDAATSVNMGRHQCPGEVLRDTLVVHNRGESPLDISSLTWQNNNGFRVISPSVPPATTIQPFDSIDVIVEFVPLAGQNGAISDILSIVSNDTNATRSTYRVTYTADVQKVDFTYRWSGSVIDTLDLGVRCLGSGISENVDITNTGTLTTTILQVISSNPNVVNASVNTPLALTVGSTGTIILTGVVRQTGNALIPVLVRVAECPNPDTLWVRFEGVDANLTVVGTGQFGTIRVGASRQILIELRNDGASDQMVVAPAAIPSPFRIVGMQPMLPALLKPGTSVIITFEYAPTAVGTHTTEVRFTTPAGGRQCSDTAIVILAGTAIQASLELSKEALIMDPVPLCSRGSDSVTITNRGTASVRLLYPAFVNGPDAASFLVRTQPTVDIDLQPGESAVYAVDFIPSGAQDQVRTAILSVRTDDPTQAQIDIPLSGRQVPIALNGPASIDLGTSQLQVPVTKPVVYTNNTAAPISVAAVRTSDAQFTVVPQSVVIGPGGVQQFDVTFTPNGEGSQSADIWFVFDAPCADSIHLMARGQGAVGMLSAPNALNFGTLFNCQFKRDSVVYLNTSAVAVDLIDVGITGPDAALFTVENPAVATTTTLPAGERAVLYVRFDPRAVADGYKTAQLTLRARINNQPTRFVTNLSGTRQTSLPGTSPTVAFGAIDLGSASTQTFTILNNTTVPMHITAVTLRGAAGGVFTVTTTPGVPATLAPGDRMDVVVRFAPTEQRSYDDSLVVSFDLPCPDDRIVPVTGIGRLNVEAAIIMPKVLADPAADDYSLPVSGRVAIGTTMLENANLKLTIRYRSSLFVARRLSTGTITRNEAIGGFTYLDLDVSDVSINTTEAVITNIIGDVTLGPIDSTDLEIVAATLVAPPAAPMVRPVNGWLKLDICREGDDRLVQRRGALFIGTNPNPVRDVVNLDVEVFEPGDHHIMLVSSTGEVLWSETWQHVAGAQPRSIRMNAGTFGSGMYQIVLQTPTRRRVKSLLIVH